MSKIGISVKQLKDILTTTESPCKLVDPVTELPLWDPELMNLIKAAKSLEEVTEVEKKLRVVMVSCHGNTHYCLTDLSVDSNDITALVSGEQKRYFHLWGLQKQLVAFATRDFFRPHS
jgi:hypothetical protein